MQFGLPARHATAVSYREIARGPDAVRSYIMWYPFEDKDADAKFDFDVYLGDDAALFGKCG